MTTRARWTTPTELRAQLERRWKNGDFLVRQGASDAPLFPLQLGLRVPDAKALRDEFEAVRTWIRALEAGSKDTLGFGYELVWAEINHRQLGRNRVPKAVLFEHRRDALALLRVEQQAKRFETLERVILDDFAELGPWLSRRPFNVLEHAQAWPRLLTVLRWVQAQPRPGVYLRQLEIPGVDTKFIEAHKSLLAELLDLVLPASAIQAGAHPVRQFEQRYGFASKPTLIRFRSLDQTLALGPLDDVSTPAPQFARLKLPLANVFITENETNGLAFPACARSIVLFGLGYGLTRLSEVPWLQDVAVYYWGDLDTHGFAMLDRLRAHLPHARSFLMDRQTLELHRELWTEEASPFVGDLARLTEGELALFDDLRAQRLGHGVRLEQERIAYSWLRQAIAALGL